MIKKIKSLSKKQLINIFAITIALVIFLDMDQWLYPFFNSINIPLPSTFLTYIWLPLYAFLVFMILENKKKNTILIASLVGFIYLAYFVIHHFLVKDIPTTLLLRNFFYYSLKYELMYVFVLVLPLVYIYVIYRLEPSFKQVEKIMVMVAMMIAIPILVSNIFLFSPSTYVGWTQANLFTWFSDIYSTFHPREIASKFFFTEGNTTGIVLFMTFPFTLNLLNRLKGKLVIGSMVLIQGLAMFCIATRVASYGVLIIMSAYLAIVILVTIIKRTKLNKQFIFVFAFIFLLFAGMFKFTPAYVNQQMNIENNWYVLANENLRQEIKGSLDDPGLDPTSQEYLNFYSHIFVDNAFLLTTPKIYYMELYDYRLDPKFWVDVIFEYDFYDRIDGRDFQKIFFDFQWNKLTLPQRVFGFGYSSFMFGGIVLEKDFEMQIYTHGYLGFTLLVLPWLISLGYIIYKALRNLKNSINIDVLVSGLSLCGGLICAYSSGHTLDQPFSSLLLAMLVAILIIMLRKGYKASE